MIEISEKGKCCGCTACEAVCSAHKAIKMEPDRHGFMNPVVDVEKCVDCDLCVRVCPFDKPFKKSVSFEQELYGVRLRSRADLAESQSGGAFQAVAKTVIDKKGVVYGVAFDDDMNVRHCRISHIDDLPKLYGSKYVQSDLNDSFNNVVSDLRKGLTVLFSGVGCQVAGLISLCNLKRIPTENLLTTDLICYGTPSPQYWKGYIGYLKKRYSSEVKNFLFRDKKSFGWRSPQSSFTLADGRKISPQRNFYNPLLFRRSCYECPFTSFNRTSDITIGDFWGIERVKPEWADDNMGVSLMLINTTKGKHLFDSVCSKFDYFATNTSECRQPQLIAPHPVHPLKEKWERCYEKYGFEKASRKCEIIVHPTAYAETMSALKRHLKKILGR